MKKSAAISWLSGFLHSRYGIPGFKDMAKTLVYDRSKEELRANWEDVYMCERKVHEKDGGRKKSEKKVSKEKHSVSTNYSRVFQTCVHCPLKQLLPCADAGLVLSPPKKILSQLKCFGKSWQVFTLVSRLSRPLIE